MFHPQKKNNGEVRTKSRPAEKVLDAEFPVAFFVGADVKKKHFFGLSIKIMAEWKDYFERICKRYPDCPWDWNIYLYIYHKFKPNVGKYSSPIEHMG